MGAHRDEIHVIPVPVGNQEVAQGPLNAELVERRLNLLGEVRATLGVILSRGSANLLRLDGGGREGAVEHDSRRAVIPLHVRLRERQLRADPLVAVPERILVELAWLGRIVPHAEEVVDRVLIFLAAQAIVRHRRPGRHPRGLPGLEQAVEIRHERRDLSLRGPRLGLGGHLAGVHPLEHVGPVTGVTTQFEVTREAVHADVPLLLLRPVAAAAVLLEKGLERLGCAHASGHADPEDDDQPATERVTERTHRGFISHR